MSRSPSTEERTVDFSMEKVPGTTSCRTRSSRALSELLMNINSTSYLPALPAGKTSLPVLMLRRRCTTLNCGGLATSLVATGPNFSEPKSALIGAARRPLAGEGSGACNGYRKTIVLPGCRPNGAERPTVILRLLPLLSGDISLSSN